MKAKPRLPAGVHMVRARGREYFYFQPGRGTPTSRTRIPLPGCPQNPNGSANAEWWAVYHALAGTEVQSEYERAVAFEVGRMLSSARQRAKNRSLPLDLTVESLQALLKRQCYRCAISGLQFEMSRADMPTARRPFAPSLDQIEASKGYELSNCRIVTTIANYAMGAWGLAALSRLAWGIVAQEVANRSGTEFVKRVVKLDESSRAPIV
jgi:hypothetical protein